LQAVLEAVPFELTTDGGVEASRQRFRDLPRRPVHPDVRTEDRTIDGPAGTIPLRVYWPPTDDEATLPVIVFLHGGGWSVGDLDTYDGEARNHAVGAGALVVSVDYRLAPEHPYPAAVEDAWAATQWVAAHARELGADPDRLAVAGDSAGGNLAAVVAQLAREHRAADPVPVAVVSGDDVGHKASVVHGELGRTAARRQSGQRAFPVVCGRFGSLGHACDAGSCPSQEPGRPASGVHRRCGP
jgi:acetyl esterase/lipase